jgi:hypothetical protein
MAKARIVIGDQNSAELDALKRSFNSLLVVLEQIAIEEAATTTTAVQSAQALANALTTGVDSTASTGHTPTGRMVVGIKSTPGIPSRRAEEANKLVTMSSADKF